MKTTIGLLVTLALAILVPPLAADGQQPGKVYRIEELSLASGPGPFYEAFRLYEIFRQGLLELGWVERQNFAIESRYAAGNVERLHDLATELVRLQVDVILTADRCERACRGCAPGWAGTLKPVAGIEVGALLAGMQFRLAVGTLNARVG